MEILLDFSQRGLICWFRMLLLPKSGTYVCSSISLFQHDSHLWASLLKGGEIFCMDFWKCKSCRNVKKQLARFEDSCSTETKKDDIEKVNEVKCCLMRCWKAAGNPLPDFLEAEAWPLGMEEDGAKVAGPSNSFVLFECSSTKAVNWILKAVSFFSRKFSPYTNGCQQPVAFTGTPTL